MATSSALPTSHQKAEKGRHPHRAGRFRLSLVGGQGGTEAPQVAHKAALPHFVHRRAATRTSTFCGIIRWRIFWGARRGTSGAAFTTSSGAACWSWRERNISVLAALRAPTREERETGYNWWPQEMPSDEEYAACEANLEANGWQVDYVLTHDAPSRFP